MHFVVAFSETATNAVSTASLRCIETDSRVGSSSKNDRSRARPPASESLSKNLSECALRTRFSESVAAPCSHDSLGAIDGQTGQYGNTCSVSEISCRERLRRGAAARAGKRDQIHGLL